MSHRAIVAWVSRGPRHVRFQALMLCAAMGSIPCGAEPYAIRLLRTDEPRTESFAVIGLDLAERAAAAETIEDHDHASALFSIYALAAGSRSHADLPPMSGAYEIEGGALRFVPRYPLQPGLVYRAVFSPSLLSEDSSAGAEAVTAQFEIPKARSEPTTVVERVYPTANTLPENQLKFYIHFSAPMSRGKSYEYVHLMDDQGREVRSPFLELTEELWDREGRRFTLYFDPGRIKRELRPHREFGRALTPGRTFYFVVDSAWPDAKGNPLKRAFQKEFRVAEPDYEPLDMDNWRLGVPPARTREPMTVTFPEPIERALLDSFLWIADEAGKEILGKVEVSAGETVWAFTPDQPWDPGRRRLHADSMLEDLAGNKIGRAFEIDMFNRIDTDTRPEIVSRSFSIE